MFNQGDQGDIPISWLKKGSKRGGTDLTSFDHRGTALGVTGLVGVRGDNRSI